MSGKPAFLYCDYADAATVTATDSLAGTDPINMLYATEDTVWSPANATGEKEIVIDRITASAFDTTVFLGENLDGLQVLTTTSTDNFATDTDYSLNNDVVINGDFPSGLDGWDIGVTSNITITSPASWAVFSATATNGVSGTLEQQNAVGAGQSYVVQYTISVIDSPLLEVSVYPQGAAGSATKRNTVGTFTELLTGTGTRLEILVRNTGGVGIGDLVLITDVRCFEFFQLSAINNATHISYPATSSDRYIKYTISNPSTSLQIAHICPDTLIEQPWLDKDPIAEDVSPTFNNLVSTGGLFLGNNQINTMRAIDIDFGEVTDSEYTIQIEPWVDACIKVARPFYFLPDSTNTDEIYFCWLEDNEGFRAPLINGNRTVSAVAAKTRLS